jgi:uncharacterized BrkB/YihY/UPF0761 family membrane protein
VRLRRFPAGAALVLRRGAESLIREAGTREVAQLAFFTVMSFPAILLLLVWSFSAVLDDNSVRQSIVDLIAGALPLADPSDRHEVETLLNDVAAGPEASAGSGPWPRSTRQAERSAPCAMRSTGHRASTTAGPTREARRSARA